MQTCLRLLTGSAHVGGRVGGCGPAAACSTSPSPRGTQTQQGAPLRPMARRHAAPPATGPTRVPDDGDERAQPPPTVGEATAPRRSTLSPSPTVGPSGVWSRMSVGRVGWVRFLVTSPLTFLRAPHGVDPTRSDDMISHAPPGPLARHPRQRRETNTTLSSSLSLSTSPPLHRR